MSPEDVALCQQAIELANSGQKQAAYEQFCSIHNRSNPDDVTLLYWIAFTTPSLEEAQRATDTIARIEPDHPKLPALRAYVDRKEEREHQQQKEEQEKQAASYVVRQVPIIECPYCHGRAPAIIKSKVSTGGWVLFAILLLGLLLLGFMGIILGFPVCCFALLIQEKYQVCAFCGIKLG